MAQKRASEDALSVGTEHACEALERPSSLEEFDSAIFRTAPTRANDGLTINGPFHCGRSAATHLGNSLDRLRD